MFAALSVRFAPLVESLLLPLDRLGVLDRMWVGLVVKTLLELVGVILLAAFGRHLSLNLMRLRREFQIGPVEVVHVGDFFISLQP